MLTLVARILVLKTAEPGIRRMFHLVRVRVALKVVEAKRLGRQAYRQQ